MARGDDVVNRILAKTKSGFRKAVKAPTDAGENRATPEAFGPDVAYIRSKQRSAVPSSSAADFSGALDARETILKYMGPKSDQADTAPAQSARDVRIVKIENDRGQKTRTVLDVTGKKTIGEAS